MMFQDETEIPPSMASCVNYMLSCVYKVMDKLMR